MGEVLGWARGVYELAQPRSISGTASGTARYISGLHRSSRVELALRLWRTEHDNARRWRFGRGDNYAAAGGRGISRARRSGAMGTSATSIRAFRAFCMPFLEAIGPDGPGTYLEFGACCGTTVLAVLEHFPGCRAVAFEPLADRSRVHDDLRKYVPVDGRLTWIEDLFEHHIAGVRATHPAGIDAIYMDTNHLLKTDLRYLERILIEDDLLAKDGLLICDDRFHSGTRQAINTFLERHPRRFDYRLIAGRWAMFRHR